VLCFHDVESLLTAVVEFAARFAFSIESSLADYAYSAIAGETTADSPLCDVECGCDWIDYLSGLSNEVFAGAVNASCARARCRSTPRGGEGPGSRRRHSGLQAAC
jgi:hypothetical protein